MHSAQTPFNVYTTSIPYQMSCMSNLFYFVSPDCRYIQPNSVDYQLTQFHIIIQDAPIAVANFAI